MSDLTLEWMNNIDLPQRERVKLLGCRIFMDKFEATLKGHRSTERGLKEASSELKLARDVLAPIPSDEVKNKIKSVAQIHPATGKVVAKFQSMADAARAINRHHCVIADVLDGRTQTGGGYKWVKIRRHKVCKHCSKLKLIREFRKTNTTKAPQSNKCFKCEPRVARMERTVKNMVRKENHLRRYAKSVTLIADGVVEFIKPLKFQHTAIKLGRSESLASLLKDRIEMTDVEVTALSIELTSQISDYIVDGTYQKVMAKIHEHLKDVRVKR